MLKRALTIMLLSSTAALAQQPAAPVIEPSPALSVLQADFTRVTQDINAVLLENQNKITAMKSEAEKLAAWWADYDKGAAQQQQALTAEIAGLQAAGNIKPKP